MQNQSTNSRAPQGLEQEARYAEILERVRLETATDDDWTALKTRVAFHLPDAERATFAKPLRIYSAKADSADFNAPMIRDSRRPCLPVKADHRGQGAIDASYETAKNLHKLLQIWIGARVMLTQTTWAERGLVNGAFGKIRDVRWFHLHRCFGRKHVAPAVDTATAGSISKPDWSRNPSPRLLVLGQTRSEPPTDIHCHQNF